MKKFITRISALTLGVSAALVGTSAMADVAPIATATVSVVLDITVAEQTAMSFGNEIVPVAGKVCELESTQTSNAESGGGNGDGDVTTAWGWLSGSECGGESGITGSIFSIAGEVSQDVQVSLLPTDATEVIFTPHIIYIGGAHGLFNQTGLTTDDGAALTALKSDLGTALTPQTVSLDASGDGALLIGGKLEVVNLTAGQTGSTLNYTVSVIY
jgi:hypothetical protein